MRKGAWALNKLQLLQLLADIMYANRQPKPDHEVKKVIHLYADFYQIDISDINDIVNEKYLEENCLRIKK